MSVIIFASFLMMQAAAYTQPQLHPRLILPGEGPGPSFWLRAPIIAIVTISDAQWVGPEIDITPPRKLVVRRVSVDAQVENVIQGELSTGPLRFYFFTNSLSPNKGYTTLLSWFDPGKRYVV